MTSITLYAPFSTSRSSRRWHCCTESRSHRPSRPFWRAPSFFLGARKTAHVCISSSTLVVPFVRFTRYDGPQEPTTYRRLRSSSVNVNLRNRCSMQTWPSDFRTREASIKTTRGHIVAVKSTTTFSPETPTGTGTSLLSISCCRPRPRSGLLLRRSAPPLVRDSGDLPPELCLLIALGWVDRERERGDPGGLELELELEPGVERRSGLANSV